MFKVSYFLEVLPIIASKVNVTFELTIAATIFALVVGVIIAIIGYYKIPGLYKKVQYLSFTYLCTISLSLLIQSFCVTTGSNFLL